MTQWLVKHGDILELEVDGLICSANPSLNLSGGVGGALLLRYGTEMQEFLHAQLHAKGKNFVSPGEVVVANSLGTPYRAVAHAVAIDAFYETSEELIERTYEMAIQQLATHSCHKIAAACLSCGYGRCPIDIFIKVVKNLIVRSFDGIESIILATTNIELADELSRVLKQK
jgi:O-acetyl-ADP-ribose deacetylase (regulator of RNase III)